MKLYALAFVFAAAFSSISAITDPRSDHIGNTIDYLARRQDSTSPPAPKNDEEPEIFPASAPLESGCYAELTRRIEIKGFEKEVNAACRILSAPELDYLVSNSTRELTRKYYNRTIRWVIKNNRPSTRVMIKLGWCEDQFRYFMERCKIGLTPYFGSGVKSTSDGYYSVTLDIFA